MPCMLFQSMVRVHIASHSNAAAAAMSELPDVKAYYDATSADPAGCDDADHLAEVRQLCHQKIHQLETAASTCPITADLAFVGDLEIVASSLESFGRIMRPSEGLTRLLIFIMVQEHDKRSIDKQNICSLKYTPRTLVASTKTSVAVEVLGVITRVGHRSYPRAVYHVHHTRSLRGR